MTTNLCNSWLCVASLICFHTCACGPLDPHTVPFGFWISHSSSSYCMELHSYIVYTIILMHINTLWGKMSCDQHLTCVMQQYMYAQSDVNNDGGSHWQGGRMVSLDQRCPPQSTVHQLMQSAYASLRSLPISLVVHHQGYLIW